MPAETEAPGRPARRTRLSPERERELYEAVVDLLREVGYEALTMDAVAARTRSSKATLYRQWRGKPELVAAALEGTRPGRPEDIDTGSLAGDLREMLRQMASHSAEDMAVMRALFHAVATNPDLDRAMRETLIEPGLAGLRHMVDRAVARGEVAPDRPARDFVAHAVVGAMMGRPMVEGRDPDPAYLMAYLDAVVLPALGIGERVPA
jgi:AcrR family transcriptional regulator